MDLEGSSEKEQEKPEEKKEEKYEQWIQDVLDMFIPVEWALFG
jgi:hypothetical protein